MKIVVFTNQDNRVTRIHYRPADLPDEQVQEGFMVDKSEIPSEYESPPDGKLVQLFYSEEEGFSTILEDAPEKSYDTLQQQIDSLQQELNNLKGQ